MAEGYGVVVDALKIEDYNLKRIFAE